MCTLGIMKINLNGFWVLFFGFFITFIEMFGNLELYEQNVAILLTVSEPGVMSPVIL